MMLRGHARVSDRNRPILRFFGTFKTFYGNSLTISIRECQKKLWLNSYACSRTNAQNVRMLHASIDRSIPLTCCGCGVELQTRNKKGVGYLPRRDMLRAAKEATAAAHEERTQQAHGLICQRCYQTKHYGKMVPSTVPYDTFRRYLEAIRPIDCLVVQVFDIFDFEGSLVSNLGETIGDKPLIVVINKCDLLPNSTNFRRVHDWIRGRLNHAGVTNILDVVCVSARLGKGVEDTLSSIGRHRKGRDVYVIGAANVGKSSLVNRLLQSLWAPTKSTNPRNARKANKKHFAVLLDELPEGYSVGDTYVGDMESLKEHEKRERVLKKLRPGETSKLAHLHSLDPSLFEEEGAPHPRYLVSDASGKSVNGPRNDGMNISEAMQTLDKTQSLDDAEVEAWNVIRKKQVQPNHDKTDEYARKRALYEWTHQIEDRFRNESNANESEDEDAKLDQAIRISSTNATSIKDGIKMDYRGRVRDTIHSAGTADGPRAHAVGNALRDANSIPPQLQPLRMATGHEMAHIIGGSEYTPSSASLRDDTENLAASSEIEQQELSALRAMPFTTSPLPGTTLGVVGAPLTPVGKAKIYDTPGVVSSEAKQKLLEHMSSFGIHTLRQVLPQKRLKLIHYRLRPGKTMFLGGLVRIDYSHPHEDVHMLFTPATNLRVHITSTSRADELWERHYQGANGEMETFHDDNGEFSVFNKQQPNVTSQSDSDLDNNVSLENNLTDSACAINDETTHRSNPLHSNILFPMMGDLSERMEYPLRKSVPWLDDHIEQGLPPVGGSIRATRRRRQNRERRSIIDIALAGLGWVAVTPIEIRGMFGWERAVGMGNVTIHYPPGVDVAFRDPLLPHECSGTTPRDWRDRSLRMATRLDKSEQERRQKTVQ